MSKKSQKEFIEHPAFKGTKGNWELFWFTQSDFPIALGVAIELERGYWRSICDAILPDSDEEYLKDKQEHYANIALLSASKDLLIACQNLLNDYSTENRTAANKAIQKALIIKPPF